MTTKSHPTTQSKLSRFHLDYELNQTWSEVKRTTRLRALTEEKSTASTRSSK